MGRECESWGRCCLAIAPGNQLLNKSACLLHLVSDEAPPIEWNRSEVSPTTHRGQLTFEKHPIWVVKLAMQNEAKRAFHVHFKIIYLAECIDTDDCNE